MDSIDRRRAPTGASSTSATSAARNPGRGSGQASDFPACACDALHQVSKSLRQHGIKSRGILPPTDLQATLDQDLFCLASDRRSTRLTPIQQLKLLELLCSFFQEKYDEGKQRYLYFELIFCGREGETVLHEARISLLIKLCSLAVQYPCHSLLVDVSLWLNKVGLLKPYAKQIVSTLVEHFCSCDTVVAEPGQDVALHAWLNTLSTSAPEMAQYIWVLSLKDNINPLTPLIAVIGYWMCNSAKRLVQLIKTGELCKTFATETFPNMIMISCNRQLCDKYGDDMITSQFHTGLLHVMIAWIDGDLSAYKLLNSSQIISGLEMIRSRQTTDNCLLAVERMAQCLQLAIVSKCFAGSLDDIRNIYESIHISSQLFAYIFGEIIDDTGSNSIKMES